MSKYSFLGICLQCLLGTFIIAKEGNAQSKTSIEEIYLSIHFEDTRLDNAFLEIEAKTNFKFAYNDEILRNDVRVSLGAENVSLANLLRTISKEKKLQFTRINDNIIVSKRKLLSEAVVEELINIKQVTVSGKVTSQEDGEPLPGVSVLLKGTSTGTTTDFDGKFSLNIPENSTLSFSYIGFKTMDIEVGNQSILNIEMVPDLAQLEEVVVVGYGTVKKSDLTGSVSSVNSEELTAYPAIGTVQALQGRAAGVQITANNGEPGSSYKIRVRGGTSINASSDPIFVVDGFVGGVVPPPEDIASIEILKDASATAIYGSRGANGVIMVTTKKGKSGKTKIDFNTSFSSQEEIGRLDLLNAAEFQDYIQEVTPNVPMGTEDTDWQDAIYQKGHIQNYQLSLSGGSDNVSYYVSGIYYDQKGIIVGSQYDRYSITSNLDIKATEKLKLGINLFASRTERDGVPTQEGSGGSGNTGVVASAYGFAPDLGIYNPDGSFTVNKIGDPFDNPYAISTQKENETVNDLLQANLSGEYEIFKDLKFRASFGANTGNRRNGNFLPTTLNAGANVGGRADLEGNKNTNILSENYLTYSKSFGSLHDFSIMGGYSYQKSRGETWGARADSYNTNAVSFWDLDGSAVYQRPWSSLSEWELSSWYSRINYSFNSKYLLTLNLRYDGSSTFSKNNKWAFFPSGAFAWNMHEESFLNNSDLFSQFKWRVSYGLTGNRAIAPYQTLARLSPQLAAINGQIVNAVRPSSVANDNLTWETTAQFDVGADIGLFNDRVNLVVDYYRMETSDLLFQRPLPEYSGYTTQWQNIGKVENKGFELTLNTRNLVGEFKWDMAFNISANRNKVLELPDNLDIPYGSNPGHMVGMDFTQILRVGEPVGAFFGFIYDGVYQEGDNFIEGSSFEQEAGGEKYRDVDGITDENGDLTGQPDGQLNNNDKTIVGNPQPKYIWGWNNDFSWKGFDMNIFFQASKGNDIYSYTLMELDKLSGGRNATKNALNRWTPTNTNTDVPKAAAGRGYKPSTRWIYDGSYVRLKNISLGYNLPNSILEKAKIRRLRIYVSAQNILTFTDYEGVDPEVNYRTDGGTNGNRNVGLDYGSYPNAKSYSIGLNVGF
ncbi:TonB-dependent receptor [Flexithrix dorotheae]|uniref:TonB-dependent receptor n=1 Tax=Flexithrix dorotheae TaxID=70993 RepID=UPI00037FE518|nr:TonB-dependent receptor [Flexithrix dorotheae]